MTKELFVDLDTCQIGTLDEENGSLRFRYEDAYRNDPSEIPESSWIPLREEA